MTEENPTPTDSELMFAVRRGSRDAFETLMIRWQQPVIHFLFRILPDSDEAEDLAQGVFVQLWKTAPRYEPTAKFSTFLFTIARNLGLNEIRRRSRHPTTSLDASSAGDDEPPHHHVEDPQQLAAPTQLENAELVQKVEAALADLPENQRIALALCREGELSYEEIAEVLGTTVPATKSLIHRAREILKARLKPYLRTGEWTHPV